MPKFIYHVKSNKVADKMASKIIVQRSTESEIQSIVSFLESNSRSQTLTPYVSELVREGRSVVAKTEDGTIVGHSGIFVGKEGGIRYPLTVIKGGHTEALGLMTKELKQIIRKDESKYREHAIIPGTCDK